jgi:hypothetical protein
MVRLAAGAAGELSVADRVRWLAREFGVTASAMKILR